MKLIIPSSAARTSACAAIATRLFIGLALEAPAIHNGAWIAALLGGLLAIPWAMALGWLSDCRGRATAPLRLALLVCLVADSALLFDTVTRSAGYLALDRRDPTALLIPAALAALWCVLRGGDAVGYGAMIWARLFPALMLVVVLLQLKHYRPQWLTPVLGPGWRAIGLAGARSAGRVMLASGVLLIADDGEKRERSPVSLLRAYGCGVIAAAGLIVLRLMMTPTMPHGASWLSRLDSLLVNGRAPLYLQLPMIALWFAGLMHLLACECFTAAALAHRLLSRLPGWACAASVLSVAAMLSQSEAAKGLIERCVPWTGAILALCAAVAFIPAREGGAKPCAR